MPLGEPNGKRRGRIARFGGTNARVFCKGNVIAILLVRFGLGGLNHRCILAMRGDDERRACEDAFERDRVVHEHVAGRSAHEHLDATNERVIYALDGFEVVVGRTKVEGVVGHRVTLGDGELIVYRIDSDGLWPGVRHLHVARDAASDGRPRFSGDAALVRKPRLAEMHLIVNNARQQKVARKVHFLGGAWYGKPGADGGNTHAFNKQVAFGEAAIIDNTGVFDAKGRHGVHRFKDEG